MVLYPGVRVTAVDESTMLRAPRRPARWERLAPLLAALLTFMVATDALCTALDIGMLEGVRRQIDITREGNLAAWFSGLVFGMVAVVCALLAWRAWSASSRQAASACVWCAGAGAFGVYGVTTAMAIHDIAARALVLRLRAAWFRTPGNAVAGLFSLEALGALSLLLMCGYMLYAMRGNRRIWLLASLGLALMASSPVAERFENRLISDPHNYVFVANDQPYRFSHAAADRLWVVSHVKEGVETAGAVALLAGLLAYYAPASDAARGRLRRLP